MEKPFSSYYTGPSQQAERRADLPIPGAGLALSRAHARAAGLLFLVILVVGPFSILYVPSQILVTGDASATAENLRGATGLLRVGMLGDIIIFLTEVAMAAVLFTLFRQVNRTLALTMGLARLSEAVMQAVAMLGYIVALAVSTGILATFPSDQQDAVTLLALEMHGYTVYVGQLFFGLSLLILGYLMIKAPFVPRLLGILMFVAAVGYLTDSLVKLLWPDLAGITAVAVGVTALIGEVPFFVWLLVKGFGKKTREVMS
jgi:hypothetical protein